MKKKWIEQLSHVDDFYLEEADPSRANNKKKKRWYQSKSLIAGIACVLLFGAAILFVPYRTTAMVLYRIFAPAQYDLITKIDTVIDDASAQYNSWEAIVEQYEAIFVEVESGGSNLGFMQGESLGIIIGSTAGPTSYEEVTDNQVDGIIEGDLIKRSDSCIFYLYDSTLYAYSIEQDNSKLLDSYDFWDYSLNPEFGPETFYLSDWEFYLSSDCSTVTVILNYYDSTKVLSRTPWVEVINLDVSDPSNITKIDSIKTTGYYKSSRLVDGNLLLFTKYTKTAEHINYLDKSTYLPYTICEDEEYYIEADSIVCPDTISSLKYTVIQMLDAETLDIKDSFAYLSYSDNIYVSSNHIYTSYTFTNDTRGESLIVHEDASKISCLAYTADGFLYKGDFVVPGYLENQYSMDEYEGVLRMVTTLNGFSYVPVKENGETKVTEYTEFMNASLYCIDVNSLSVIAEVNSFAPEDENVESVRFDQDKAYVCTVYTPGLKDPVFAFDLSDMNNITYVNTGIIEGYSYALIDLNDDYVLGLGIGSSDNMLKIEVYKENEDMMESICSYSLDNVLFSRKYKAYYVDRDNNLLGFSYNEGFGAEQYYVLLHFNDNQFQEVVKTPLSGTQNHLRSVYIDEYLYMFGKDGSFLVEKVELNK